ncbi:MAG: glycosyltransferase [Alphaproteobacteria bacterium]|nr:glycosyltransferase [Alphaproteobacteria bacterium]
MKIGLCMIVKNEARRIVGSLEGIIDLLDQVVVIDTGSSDGTPDILRREFGIEAGAAELVAENCYALSGVRNEGFAKLNTPWILLLDADERIARDQFQRVIDIEEDGETSGYFCAWNTFKDNTVIEDYKLSIFRNGLKQSGRIHDTVQYDVREQGLHAAWLDGVEITHYPDDAKWPSKKQRKRERLNCALRAEPSWYRYYWFLGYMAYQENHPQEAIRNLSIAAESQSMEFPVECLNSEIVLAEIHASLGNRDLALKVLARARAFHDSVAEDFEVKINFRLRPWLDQALEYCRRGELEKIKAYQFAY